MTYETILVEQRGGVTLVTLNRPQALNALNSQILADMLAAMAAFDADPSQGCAVITGSEKAFAAGADIKEMQAQGFADMYAHDFFAGWDRFTRTRKPIIAAVAGYALGGGCEMAMMCDFILAADTAKFGQPEINLGAMPGAGGTQRLTRFVGKSKAMAMCLTGDQIDAAEALSAGLVAAVHAPEDLVEEAVKMAAKIAGLGRPSVMMCKEAVNAAYELSLNEGNRLERRLFARCCKPN